MPRFAELLASGESSAFEQAFGRNMQRAVTDLGAYLRQARPATIDGSAPAATVPPNSARIAAAEAAMLRADLALRTSHPEVARRWFLQIARDSPATAASETALAMLAMIADDAIPRAHTSRSLWL